MDVATVAFVTKITHDLTLCQTIGSVLEYAPPDEGPPKENDDDVSDADMVVVADNDVRNIVAIKKALRNGDYPGIVVAVVFNPTIPIKKSDEPESDWDRANFHFGADTKPSELSDWIKRRIADVVEFHASLVCVAG